MGQYGDAIEYDGVRWNPNPKDPYYRNSRRGLLHRWMWTKEVGPIPAGMQVHHKNHDKRDNRIGNFELLPPGKHWAEHGEERGADWHSKGGKASDAKRVRQDFTCDRCGSSFSSRAHVGQRIRYCSNACRDFASRPREERVCGMCGTRFTTAVRSTSRTCSRQCTADYVARVKRGQGLRFDGRA